MVRLNLFVVCLLVHFFSFLLFSKGYCLIQHFTYGGLHQDIQEILVICNFRMTWRVSIYTGADMGSLAQLSVGNVFILFIFIKT